MIPYTEHHLEPEDIIEVMWTLQSSSITQGSMIDRLENEFRKAVGSNYAVAVSSGTAALHAALMAAGIGPADEVIVPSMTFVATANAVKYMGARPIFADINKDTLLIDLDDAERKITSKTKAIIAVDFAGQPADYVKLYELKSKYGITIIADACHSLGAVYKGKAVGTLADFNCFSLHATKLITSAEGGIITTNDRDAAQKMQAFRNHGRVNGDMILLGYNYRMSEVQAALCLNQINRIVKLVEDRKKIALHYDTKLHAMGLKTIKQEPDRTNARHIYLIKTKHRDYLRKHLIERGINTQIHYKPVTLQSFYNCPGTTPIAEKVWEELMTIPLYPHLTNEQQLKVIEAIQEATILEGGCML